jgi:anti-anti-sigma regulatory factor
VSKFQIDLTLNAGQAIVSLEGVMDEDMVLEKVQGLNEGTLIFDFDKVTSINSCGIRDWITFISSKATDSKIVYRKCPKVIIEQLNMVKGFLPEGAQIESFYAPFFCESCENEEMVLLSPDHIKGRKAPTNLPCSQCKTEGIEFDALESQYFHFLPEA